MPTHRRLAAVLIADVAGYSRLIGLDEERTLSRLGSIRTNIVDPTIAASQGRLVRLSGDGLLVEFASVIDAIRCANEVQRMMASYNDGLPVAERIDFRIGINVGEIVIGRGHFRRWREHRRSARSFGRRRRHLRFGSGSGGCGRTAGPRLRRHGRA